MLGFCFVSIQLTWFLNHYCIDEDIFILFILVNNEFYFFIFLCLF
jgi:hypothetical protein